MTDDDLTLAERVGPNVVAVLLILTALLLSLGQTTALHDVIAAVGPMLTGGIAPTPAHGGH